MQTAKNNWKMKKEDSEESGEVFASLMLHGEQSTIVKKKSIALISFFF